MNDIIISKKAEKEITDAYFFYEELQTGLGDKLITALDIRFEKIKKYPERFPSKVTPYRETIIKTFPFLIIYRYNKPKKYIFISSIFHTSRNPKKKYR